MKKSVFLILVFCIAIVAMSAPRLVHNGQNTDYRYYSHKYADLWELTDSIGYGVDTIYTYTLGGQYFIFDQNGKLLLNQ